MGDLMDDPTSDLPISKSDASPAASPPTASSTDDTGPVYLAFPDDMETMSEEEQDAVIAELAEALRRELRSG